jgi:hypothetical protein
MPDHPISFLKISMLKDPVGSSVDHHIVNKPYRIIYITITAKLCYSWKTLLIVLYKCPGRTLAGIATSLKLIAI